MRVAILRSHHVLAVHDLRSTAAYFRDVLGFRIVHEPPGWAFLARDRCVFMIGECREALAVDALGDHRFVAYLVVDDARALHAEWAARAPEAVGAVEDKPWGMREFAVRTPEGHRLGVGQEIAQEAPRSVDPAAFARSWLGAFNAADLDAIMAHYADEVEHSSPTVARLLGEPSGIVRGKAALRAYFEKALAAAGPGLRYDLTRVYAGAHGVTILYDRSGGKLVAETFHFDDRGLVSRAFVAHAERAP